MLHNETHIQIYKSEIPKLKLTNVVIPNSAANFED